MRIIILMFAFGSILAPSSWASLSIFEQGQQFEGKVKAISIGDDIRVRLVSGADGSESRLVNLCVNDSSSFTNTRSMNQETMREIRGAMAHGRTVRVGYSNSLFDRCIKQVQVVY